MKNIIATICVLCTLSIASAEDKILKREAGIAGGWPEIQTDEGSNAKAVNEKAMMVSWGDVVFMYGPETDAGVGTPEQIRNMMKYWKSNGFTQIFWRGEDNRDPNFVWNESTMYAEASFIRKEYSRVMSSFDTTDCAIKSAHEMGMKIYMWASVFDDGTAANKPHRFWSDRFPWRNILFDKHPELEVRDRKGDVQWGVRELVYPLARSTKIADYINVVKKYPDLDGVLIYIHSHSAAGFHGDQYGFNQPIVDEYKKRYGVDILTDAQFDYKNPKFNPKDEAVEKWRSLRGEYLTQFLREIKSALGQVRPGLQVVVNTQGGDYMGPPFGNIRTDWRTWINEGLIDEIIVRTWMAGSAGAYDFSKEGYLTWGDGNLGVTPYVEMRKAIDKSGRDIKLLTRTRAYIEGADGYYDSSNRDESYPKKQRAIQLQENLAKYGKIVFIDQNFENVLPLEKTSCLDCTFGGKRWFIGDARYYSSKNSSPGFAGPFTTNVNSSPALVDVTGINGKGFAAYIDSDGKELTVIRRTGPGWPDLPLSSGHVTISFAIYRKPGAKLSIGTLNYGNQAQPATIQLIISDSGKITASSANKWVDAKLGVAQNCWQLVNISVNFEKGTFVLAVDNSSSAPIQLEKEKAAFNGLGFRCRSQDAFVDDLKITVIK
ncbi:MAG: hypothetical protein A2Y12_13535 [Planctomycetes bacterium GWF2_42_9]|nr:MAG: hypothetical protein A2Y12_13535 [Planctomycetes bacterium GWF2_42_9]